MAADDSKAIPLRAGAAWGKRDIPLRERALRRLPYDSAARAESVLALDVSDHDLAYRQALSRHDPAAKAAISAMPGW